MASLADPGALKKRIEILGQRQDCFSLRTEEQFKRLTKNNALTITRERYSIATKVVELQYSPTRHSPHDLARSRRRVYTHSEPPTDGLVVPAAG
jgi:hypothetical protein